MAAAARNAARGLNGLRAVFLAAIAAAWVVAAWTENSGFADHLGHHALEHSALPAWQAALAVFASWQVMTVAMMLPTSLPFMLMYARVARDAPRYPVTLLLLVIAYLVVWSSFAVLAYLGDTRVHAAAHAWRWLGDRPQVIAAGTLALAAVYQVTPLKDACLRACRHPGVSLLRRYRRGLGAAWDIGVRHALFCVGCCWALMLVMFAVGVAHLAWMGVLCLVMLAEKTWRHGVRLTAPIGAGLAVLAVLAVVAPESVPGL